MKRLLLIFALLPSLAVAQTTYSITANVPSSANITNDGFLVLPGSVRQINAQISATNGTTATPCGPSTSPACVGTVNWTASGTGGATATFTDPTHTAVSSISGALATVQVNIGSTAGTCSQSPAAGSAGPYTISASAYVTVTAQSTDDVSKTASFVFYVCPNATATLPNGTSSVAVTPAYAQLYQGQKRDLLATVYGCVDQSGVWSIVSQPAGASVTLADTTYRTVVFPGSTVTGEYTLKYTANCNGGTNTAIVYVSPNAMPSYATTDGGAVPTECYVDPTAFTTDYEVGAGYTYADLASTPLQSASAAGTIIRIHNTDTTGTSPSVYYNYLNVHNSGGTAAAPYYICGVPDSTGKLPILDGNGATTQAGAATTLVGCGIITLVGPSHYGTWQAGSSGPFYTTVAGLHLRNATPAYSFTSGTGEAGYGCGVTGPGPTYTWVAGADGVYVGGGSYIDVAGNDLDTNTNGVGTYENAGSNLWSTVSQNVSIYGNLVQNSGWSTDDTEHQLYLQSFNMWVEGNDLQNYLSTAKGSNIKSRGPGTVVDANYLTSGPARDLDFVEVQDASGYVSLEQYLGTGGPYVFGDTLGVAGLAWYQELLQHDAAFGNIIANNAAGDEFQVHYAEDHDGAMSARNGKLLFYDNTMPYARVIFANSTANGYNTYFQPRVQAQNNIFWTSGTNLALDQNEPLIFEGLTNLFHTGSMVITTPIVGGNYNGGTATGWQAGCDYTCKWPLTNPLNTHIYSLASGNYLRTGTQPFNNTTFTIPSGSAAIGAGSALTGDAALLPVRWQYNVATGTLSQRTSLADLGAVQYSTVVTPSANSSPVLLLVLQ